MIMNLSDVQESAPAMGGGSEYQINPTNPVSNPVSGSKVNSFVNDDETDIKTKSSQNALADSTHHYPPRREDTNDARIKIVDQKQE